MGRVVLGRVVCNSFFFEGVWSDGWSYKCEVGIDGLGSGWGWRLGRVRGGVSW